MTTNSALDWDEVFRDPAIDASQLVKQKMLRLQEPMNAVIDRGDSPVQQFYRGATVLVTGGSGFLGKQLIEKLLRSCDIKKLFVLLRPRKGKTIQQRKEYMLKDAVFDQVRARKPDFADRIVPVEGDVTELKLGLSGKQWDTLTEEVDTIFHGAATVRFNAPLKEATLTNVRGTRETITLARSCRNLKNYVYISTAYTHATYDKVNKEVSEQFYESPVTPELMIQMAETFDKEQLDEMTPSFIKNWPNTYTFSKAIAEELIRLSSDLPVCVVKPPIVLGAFYEPSPGWLDMNAIQGPAGHNHELAVTALASDGVKNIFDKNVTEQWSLEELKSILLGVILGVLHVFYVNIYATLPLVPVDYVNNCTIAAGWDAAQRRRRGDCKLPLYIVANKNKFLTYRDLNDKLNKGKGRQLVSPKAVWYCFCVNTKNKFIYRMLSFVLHYIPAYMMTAVCYITGKRPKQIKSFVDIYRTIDKFSEIFSYFQSTWYFEDDNVQAMLSNMTDADRAIYNCDINNITFDDFIYTMIIGIREFIIKDGLIDTAKAVRRQRLYKILNYVVMGVFMFVFWKMLCCLYFLSCYLFELFF